MGDDVKYYCMKCGQRLIDKPTGQCSSCKRPYDLNNDITYNLSPRSPTIVKELVVTLMLAMTASFVTSFIVLNVTMMLPIQVGAPLFYLGGLLLVVIALMTSFKLYRFALLIALVIGFAWGPTFAAVLTATLRDDFTRGMNFDGWLTMGAVLTIATFIVLYPPWAIRQTLIRPLAPSS